MRERIIANSAESDRSSYNGVPCRVWLGRVKMNRSGTPYGYISVRRKSGARKGQVLAELVHRVVVRDVKGRRLTRGVNVLHLCNYSLCCEESHLVGGSQRANVRQCVEEGRHGNRYRAPVRDMQRAA